MLEINKIHLGDCYQLIKEIPDKSVDLVHTDPPYLIHAGGSGGCFGKGDRIYHDELTALSNGVDNSILVELCRVMKKINIYIWCNKNQLGQYISFFEARGCATELLTWHKTNPIPTCNNKYLSDTEYCLFFREKGVPIYGEFKTKQKYYVTGLNVKDKGIWEHPTIKPLGIVKNLIFNSTQPGDLVLDCFSGSGTTALASSQLGRNFIAIEIDEKYHSLSIQRLEADQSQQKLFQL